MLRVGFSEISPAPCTDLQLLAVQVKAAVKATYEEPDHGTQPVAQASRTTKSDQVKAGGNRSATQVACNALLGTACAVTWRYLYSGETGSRAGWTEEGRWCVVAARNQGGGEETSRVLVFAAVAFWAACCGDTVCSTSFCSCPKSR